MSSRTLLPALLAAFVAFAPVVRAQESHFDRQLKYAVEKFTEHRYELALGTLEDLRQEAQGSQIITVDYYRALCYKDRGDFNKAHEAIAACLTEGGRSSPILYVAGEIEEGLGNLANAKTFYTAAGRSPVYSRGTATIAAASIGRVAQLKADATDNTYHSMGRWDVRRMPLRIYIDQGDGLIGYDPGMRQDAINAFESWSKASGGKLTFKYLDKNSAEARDVREDWKKGAKDPGRDIHLHWRTVIPFKDKEPLGVTYPETTNGTKIPIIAYSDIYMATNEDATGKPYSSGASGVLTSDAIDQHRHQVQFVLIHEIGHALGLEHSNKRADIMYPIVFGALATHMANEPTLNEDDKRAIASVYTGATAAEPEKFDSSLVTFRQKYNANMVNAYKAAYDQYKTGHYNNAVSYLEAALKATPNDANLHFLLAGCFIKQGRNIQAKEELHKVNSLSPSSNLSMQAKTLLETLK